MTAWNIFLVVYCVVCILPVIFVGVLLSTEEYQKHHSVLVLLLHLLLTVVVAVTAPIWIPISFGAKTVYEFLG